MHLQFIPAHVGIEPHDKADKLAKEVSKDADNKPISTTMDFFAHKSRVARESHRKLMEASEKAKPPMKRVMLRQYLEAILMDHHRGHYSWPASCCSVSTLSAIFVHYAHDQRFRRLNQGPALLHAPRIGL